MDVKEIGGIGVVVVGGALFGFSQLGLNDALSEELRHISDVPLLERPAYMSEIASEFTEAFDTYSIQTETYYYEGVSTFKTSPNEELFIEVVTQDKPVPSKEIKALRDYMVAYNFCAQEEMTMFTAKGWSYKFTVEDSKGRKIFNTHCEPLRLRMTATS